MGASCYLMLSSHVACFLDTCIKQRLTQIMETWRHIPRTIFCSFFTFNLKMSRACGIKWNATLIEPQCLVILWLCGSLHTGLLWTWRLSTIHNLFRGSPEHACNLPNHFWHVFGLSSISLPNLKGNSPSFSCCPRTWLHNEAIKFILSLPLPLPLPMY